MKTRETRRLEHSKQRSTGIKEGMINKDDIPESTPVIRYIPGSGLYSVVKYLGKLYYSEYVGE
jgi:hypothetical protein